MAGISRRKLLLGAGAAAVGGAGLVLSIPLARRVRAQMRKARPIGGTAWIRIDADGLIRVYSNVGEMGQGAITGLLQALADELDADWQHVSFELAPVVDAFDGPYGHYTGGSTSIRDHLQAYRELGASARAMLMRAAADAWQVDEDACETQPGMVFHKISGKRSSYGELANAAGKLRVPRKVPLKQPSQWRYIGKPLPRLDARAKVDGSAAYGIDTVIPGMRHAAIRHCPVKNGTLISVADEPALRVRGVSAVVKLKDAVAVIADGYWAAQTGADALDPQWNLAGIPRQSTADISKLLKSLLDAPPTGGTPNAIGNAGLRLVTAEYSVPLLAQCTLEPMNGVADVRADRAELWVSTQAPSQCQQDVAQALRLDRRNVVIHPQQMGGGFGRRLHTDYAVEAALVSKAAGAPVKVIWSRQEDFLRTTLRPASMARMRGTLDVDGLLTGIVAQVTALDVKPHTTGLSPLPYDIPEVQVDYVGSDSAARIGYWRSVDHSQNIFFLECFIDECAAAAGVDPLAYRRRLLRRKPAAIEVLDQLQKLVSENGGNAANLATGWAYFEGYGGRLAVAVQVEATGGAIASRRHTLFCVADCGLVINPSLVDAQLQGALLQGYWAALNQKIDLQDGQVKQGSFADYGLMTMRDCPALHTKILVNPESAPAGVGELAVPAVAPAMANAWAKAGQRIRNLPLTPETGSAA